MAVVVYVSGVDRSTYVEEDFSFEHVKRNKNYRPIIGTADLVFKDASTGSWFARGTKIHILVDNDVRFIGRIKNAVYDYNQRVYKVEVESHLAKLQDYLVQYDTLHSVLSAGSVSQYNATDNHGYPYVQLIWLLQKMFTIGSMTLDTTEIDSAIWKNSSYYYPSYPYDIYYNKLRIDENMLYCLAQPKSTFHTNIDSVTKTENYADNKITFWDLFQEICMVFGFSVSPVTTYGDTPAFKIHKYVPKATRNYIIADNLKYDYSKVDIEPDIPSVEGYNVSWVAGKEGFSSGEHNHLARQWYADVNTENPPREYHIGTGKHGIYIMQHLLFLFGNYNNNDTVSFYNVKMGTMYENDLAARWGYHTEFRIETDIIFGNPCVLENKVIVSKNKYASSLRQEDIGEYVHW
ncbi:hypothetical protein [Immundisolibacter sp.]